MAFYSTECNLSVFTPLLQVSSFSSSCPPFVFGSCYPSGKIFRHKTTDMGAAVRLNWIIYQGEKLYFPLVSYSRPLMSLFKNTSNIVCSSSLLSLQNKLCYAAVDWWKRLHVWVLIDEIYLLGVCVCVHPVCCLGFMPAFPQPCFSSCFFITTNKKSISPRGSTNHSTSHPSSSSQSASMFLWLDVMNG